MIDRRSRRLLKPHLIVMLILFAGAAIAGVLLLPGDAERIAMLERDGSNERALKLLEQSFAAGDRSQRTLYQLEHLYAHFGDLAKSRAMLELLVAARPRDLELQRRAVRFYRDTHDTEAYLAGLSRLLTRRYSEAVCRELIAQLRLVGQFAREREAIERCRLKGYRRIDDIVRLAELEAANGDTRQAVTILRKVDDVGRLDSEHSRLTLLSLLADGGEPGEIVERVLQWVSPAAGGPPDARFALVALDLLARQRAHDAAMEVARKAGRPGDAVSLAVAGLLLDQNQAAAARAYLRGWRERADPADIALAERAIRFSLDAEDTALALELAERAGLDRLGQPSLVALAEALAASGRRPEFETVRREIASDTIAAHPLLAAMGEFDRGATASGRDILDRVATDALEPWRLALWARLMRDSGEAAAADQRLRSLGVVTAALPDEPPRVLRRRTRRVSILAPVADRTRPRHKIALARVAQMKRVAQITRAAQITRLAQGKRLKHAASIKHSQNRPGGAIARPAPVARPFGANDKRG